MAAAYGFTVDQIVSTFGVEPADIKETLSDGDE